MDGGRERGRERQREAERGRERQREAERGRERERQAERGRTEHDIDIEGERNRDNVNIMEKRIHQLIIYSLGIYYSGCNNNYSKVFRFTTMLLASRFRCMLTL